MAWAGWLDLIPSIGGMVKEWISYRHEAAIKKIDSAARIEEAKTNATISMWAKQADADIEWEKLSIQNSGWKDEYLTIFITAIVGSCFVPGLQAYVMEGFKVLSSTPLWFQTSFLVVVGSAFGVRVFTHFSNLRDSKVTK